MSSPATTFVPAAVEVRRQRVEHVALRLFVERGYRAVTIDQIAEAAGVSRRTFFRYFPEKYDVLLADTRRRQAIICAHMEQNDLEPSTFEALCQAILFSSDFDEDERVNARMRFHLSETYTDVFGRMVADTEVLSERLRKIVAGRLQIDERADMRADLVVRIVTAAAQTALRTWYSRGCKTELADHLRAAFALLGGQLLHEIAELDAAVASSRPRHEGASSSTTPTSTMG